MTREELVAKIRTLDFIQILYKDEQKEEIYDFATPYLNTVLTPYFEKDKTGGKSGITINISGIADTKIEADDIIDAEDVDFESRD